MGRWAQRRRSGGVTPPDLFIRAAYVDTTSDDYTALVSFTGNVTGNIPPAGYFKTLPGNFIAITTTQIGGDTIQVEFASYLNDQTLIQLIGQQPRYLSPQTFPLTIY